MLDAAARSSNGLIGQEAVLRMAGAPHGPPGLDIHADNAVLAA